MRNSKSNITKRIWLHLLREGPITARELREAIPELDSAEKTRNLLTSMFYRSKQVARHPGEGGYRYKVTAECAVPLGLTVAEVLEMMK